MASTLTVQKCGTISWRYDWTGTPPFKLFSLGRDLLNGGTTTDTSKVFQSDAYEPPVIEVQDSTEFANEPLTMEYPPNVTLQWRGIAGAARYLVEQYVGAAWVAVVGGNVPETKRGYVTFPTQFLTDCTTPKFRVTPYDINGYAGTAVEFEAFFVRLPDTPAVTMTYDADTGDLTIAARA
jgi:hypothetical protein